MLDVDLELFQNLLDVGSVSSDEEMVMDVFRKYLQKYTSDVNFDQMGNTWATNPVMGDFLVLLSAHADEIGMQITEICENGLLKMRRVGGVNTLYVIGQLMQVKTNKGMVPGVVVAKSSCKDNNVVPNMEECFLDIDAANKDEANAMVSLGDFVTFAPNFASCRNVLTSKSIDNRSGIFVILQVFSHLKNQLQHVNLTVAATTQEEIGLRGMAVLSQKVHPNICINIDVTDAREFDKNNLPLLGSGPVLYKNADSNPMLRKLMQSVALKHNIPCQQALGRNITGGTDTSRIQLFSPNTAVLDLAIPCKYMHSHYEKCSIKDVESCIFLLETFLKNLDASIAKGDRLDFNY